MTRKRKPSLDDEQINRVFKFRHSDYNSSQEPEKAEARKTEPDPKGIKYWDKQIQRAIKHGF